MHRSRKQLLADKEQEEREADGANRYMTSTRLLLDAKLDLARKLRRITRLKVTSHTKGMWDRVTVSGEYAKPEGYHIEVQARMAMLPDSTEVARFHLSLPDDLTEREVIQVTRFILALRRLP